ncbi:MAG: hypothetical protein ACI4XE_05735 [Acutalibacteraceae bacterium]
MRNIFIGMIFVFFNFDLNFEAVKVGLIPSFIGYIFIVKGLNELSCRYPVFSSARPFAVGMGIYSAVLYVMDLLTVSASLGYFFVPFGLVASAVSLYISYSIIKGIASIEQSILVDLNSKQLKTIWIFRAVFELCSYAYIVFAPIAIICTIAGFVVSCYYLYVFHKAVVLYESLPQIPETESADSADSDGIYPTSGE